jgi:dephospho-CoA kinase
VSRPFVVGITGPIGSGKSLVCRLLAEAHALPVLDADEIGHEALAPGHPVAAQVAFRFGRAVVRPDGGIDRGALAGIVFADPRALRDLELLVHPWILCTIPRRVAALKDAGHAGIILLDAAVLPAWIDHVALDAVVLVRAGEEIRRRRLRERGLTREEIGRRMAAQERLFAGGVPDGWLILENDGTPEALEAATAALWRRLRARFPMKGETERR